MRLSIEEIERQLATGTVHRNTLQNDDVVFLRTSAQTGGEYSLLHTLAGTGSGVVRHYHRTYTERFDVLEGVLTVEVDGKVQVLQAGETATAPMNTLHRWANQSSAWVRFLVEVAPGNEGFEKGLQIIYGLAGDGKSTPNGVPRNLLHTAWLMEISDIWLPWVSRPLRPVLHALANQARKRGIDRQLEDRYCR